MVPVLCCWPILCTDVVAALRSEEEKQCWGVRRNPEHPASVCLVRFQAVCNPGTSLSLPFWVVLLQFVGTDQCVICHERLLQEDYFPFFVKELRLKENLNIETLVWFILTDALYILWEYFLSNHREAGLVILKLQMLFTLSKQSSIWFSVNDWFAHPLE